MKMWFDKDAKIRSFKPSDKVLILLPVLGSALQARFSGPYEIQVGDRDCIVTTPDRRRRTRLCHVNTLKPYIDSGSGRQSNDGGDRTTVMALSSAD